MNAAILSILSFLQGSNIYYILQFIYCLYLFRHRHSTKQAIITVVEKITSSLDNDDLIVVF